MQTTEFVPLNTREIDGLQTLRWYEPKIFEPQEKESNSPNLRAFVLKFVKIAASHQRGLWLWITATQQGGFEDGSALDAM